MNSHLHVLEALTAYYGMTKDPAVRERLVELLLIQSGPVVNRAVGACTDQFHEDWKSFLVKLIGTCPRTTVKLRLGR